MIIIKAQKALKENILRKTPSTTKKKTKIKTSKKPNFSYPENTLQENNYTYEENIIPVDLYADFVKNWYSKMLEISNNPNPEAHYLKLQSLPPDVLVECLKNATETIYNLQKELEDYEDSFGILMNYEED